MVGLTAQQANKVLTNAGFNIRLTGGGIDRIGAVAVAQSVPENTELEKGTVIDVEFRIDDEVE